MEIVSTQIPHIFRNRFLRDGDSYMMTTNSGGGSGGSSGTFSPHYVWGQYEDGQTDIVGDFVTSADASIGGNVFIDSSLKVSGNLYVDSSVSVNGHLNVSGLSSLNNVSVGGNASLGGTLKVSGITTIGGALNTHNLTPATPTAYDIGSDSSKYGSVYAVNAYFTNVSVGGNASFGAVNASSLTINGVPVGGGNYVKTDTSLEQTI